VSSFGSPSQLVDAKLARLSPQKDFWELSDVINQRVDPRLAEMKGFLFSSRSVFAKHEAHTLQLPPHIR
jgi:hypothetical protein